MCFPTKINFVLLPKTIARSSSSPSTRRGSDRIHHEFLFSSTIQLMSAFCCCCDSRMLFALSLQSCRSREYLMLTRAVIDTPARAHVIGNQKGGGAQVGERNATKGRSKERHLDQPQLIAESLPLSLSPIDWIPPIHSPARNQKIKKKKKKMAGELISFSSSAWIPFPRLFLSLSHSLFSSYNHNNPPVSWKRERKNSRRASFCGWMAPL